MKVAVTGGAGYVGSHTLGALAGSGHQALVLDNLSAGHAAAAGGVELARVDLADEEEVFRVLAGGAVEAVMHFAASAYVGESVAIPQDYYFNNVVNTLRLLRAMRRAGIERFVFSSSCTVYGVPERVPIDEDFPVRAISPYGRTKVVVEEVLKDYAEAYGLKSATLRYFNAAGAMPDGSMGEDHRPETHLIPIVIQVALGQRKRIVINGTDYPTPDGTCVRDYVHVLDLAAAHVLALEALEAPGRLVFNLGTGRGSSVREVIDTVAQVSGLDVPVETGPRRAGDAPALVGSARRISAELGWRPAYPSLRAIVQTAWRWHSIHPDGFGPSG